jgi:hypothetical protein
MTADRTYVLASPERGGREWGYVAGSRQRIDLRLYTHSEPERAADALARGWERTRQKTLAIDRIEHREQTGRALAPAAEREDDGEPRALTALQEEGERLRELVASYPTVEARALAQLGRQAEDARRAAERAAAQLVQAREAFERLRPWQRRQRTDARAEHALAEERQERWARRDQELRRQAQTVQDGPRSPNRWEREHGPLAVRRAELERREQELRELAVEGRPSDIQCSPACDVTDLRSHFETFPDRVHPWTGNQVGLSVFARKR